MKVKQPKTFVLWTHWAGALLFLPLKMLPLTSASLWQLQQQFIVETGESKVLSGRLVHSIVNTKILLDAEKIAWKNIVQLQDEIYKPIKPLTGQQIMALSYRTVKSNIRSRGTHQPSAPVDNMKEMQVCLISVNNFATFRRTLHKGYYRQAILCVCRLTLLCVCVFVFNLNNKTLKQ